VRRIRAVTPAQLVQPVVYVLGDTRLGWESLRGMIYDACSHTGQVACIRGIVTGFGWKSEILSDA
jgi:hypothetical protein